MSRGSSLKKETIGNANTQLRRIRFERPRRTTGARKVDCLKLDGPDETDRVNKQPIRADTGRSQEEVRLEKARCNLEPHGHPYLT